MAPREGLEPPTSSSGAIRQEALNAFGFWSLETHVAFALIVIPVWQHWRADFGACCMAPREGLEPPTLCLEGRCSIQLS